MEFAFSVGVIEKHIVLCHVSRLNPKTVIRVDDVVIVSKTYVRVPKTDVFEFSVGEKDKHYIKIEWLRQSSINPFKDWIFKAYVDGEKVKELCG